MPLARCQNRFWRPDLSQTALSLLVAAYVLLALNHGFWHRVLEQFPLSDGRFAVFGLSIFGLTLALLELLGPGRLQKPVAALMILIAASAGYYERNFGVLIDREMVRNIFETTYTESRALLSWHMVATIFLTGVLPAALVFWPRVRRVRGLHQLWRWPLGVGLSLAVMIGAMFVHYKDYSAVLRERHDVIGAYQPGSALVAGLRYARQEWRSADPEAAPYGRDARMGAQLHAAEKPVLLVVYVGETARAQNFGLNGYPRDTTPELAKRDVLAFRDVRACGTSTAVSVPCMFSGLGQADYTREAGLGRENLLDVLHHAGLLTQWWDNNTGDQHVARRQGWSRVDQTLSPEACVGECTDEVFLPLIQKTAAEMTRNTVLVLHMIGSHGPAYFARYPRERAAFLPDCHSAQFSDCSTEEIVNAYDNSIRETDYVLARSIDLLAQSDRVIPALVYMSDHGESLGENGLYLHAAPAFMAPEVQTKVPFVLWLSPAFERTMGVKRGCLRQKEGLALSQDHFFSSLLGLMNVETEVRNPAFDLTQGCHEGEMM